MTTVFVVDIDGTVCDSIQRIRDTVAVHGPVETWTDEVVEEFLSDENILNDKVIPGSERLFELSEKCHAHIVFLTGRNDSKRESTRKWLTEVFKAPKHTPLLMRPYDSRGGWTADCKEQLFLTELYNKVANTFIFFEDEEDTIKRYKKYGLVLKSPECWKAIG
jgi:acid phosphatase class B